jgi:adenosine deaminase
MASIVLIPYLAAIALHTTLARKRRLARVRALISAEPKVELHIHLDGSFSQPLLTSLLLARYKADPTLSLVPEKLVLPWVEEGAPNRYLYVRQNLLDVACQILGLPPHPPVPADAPAHHSPAHAAFKTMCTCGGHRSLFAMLEKFYTFTPLIAGDVLHIEQAAEAFVAFQKANNVVYSEVRFSPHLLCCSDESNPDCPRLTPTQVTDAVIRGIKAGCKRDNIHVNIILCCICWRPEWADNTVDLAVHYKKLQEQCPTSTDPTSDYFYGNVVGVDVAAGEEHFFDTIHPDLHNPHIAAMQRAHRENIKVTMHAGEVTTAEQVEFAVTGYKASRIGHGYRAVEKAGAALEFCKAAGVHIEVCPTSSYETGGWSGEASEKSQWNKHPLLNMIGCRPCVEEADEEKGTERREAFVHGVSVGLNSDDPAVFNTDLNSEWELTHLQMGVGLDRMKQCTRDALEAAFLEGEAGDTLRKYLRAKYSI